MNVLVAIFDIIAYVVNILVVSNVADLCFSLQECIFLGMSFSIINTFLYCYYW